MWNQKKRTEKHNKKKVEKLMKTKNKFSLLKDEKPNTITKEALLQKSRYEAAGLAKERENHISKLEK